MRLAALLCTAIFALPRAAHAEPPKATPKAQDLGLLGAQAARLSQEWSKYGDVARLPARLLNQTEARPVLLNPAWLDPEVDDCVTVAVLGTQNLSFVLTFARDTEGPSARAWPVPSAAGLAEVTRCGAQKDLLQSLETEMRSRRGVAEFVVLRSEEPPPPASELLPGRTAGPSLPSPQVGPRPYLAPRKERLLALLHLHRSRGAEAVRESGLSAGNDGTGTALVHLSVGCHRLDFLAESDPSSPPDLDARLYTLSSGEELAVDQEHSGQASLKYCVGRPERFRIDVTGARPESEVTVVEARYPLPEGLPLEWGPVARAGLARALWLDTLPILDEPPVLSRLGIRGTTEVWLETDPDACYLLAAAPLRGELTRLSLGVERGPLPRSASSKEPGLGASLAFCAEGQTRVSVEVQALGNGLAWLLGVFHMGPSQESP